MSAYLKAACSGVILVILAWIGYSHYSRSEKIETLQKEVVEQTDEVKDLKRTVTTTQAAVEVSEASVSSASSEADRARATQRLIAAETERRVQAILAKQPASVRLPIPGTAEALEDPLPGLRAQHERNQLVSASRVEGLWEAYCAVDATQRACVAQKAAP